MYVPLYLPTFLYLSAIMPLLCSKSFAKNWIPRHRRMESCTTRKEVQMHDQAASSLAALSQLWSAPQGLTASAEAAWYFHSDTSRGPATHRHPAYAMSYIVSWWEKWHDRSLCYLLSVPFFRRHPFFGFIVSLLISTKICAYVLLAGHALRGEATPQPLLFFDSSLCYLLSLPFV